MIRPSIILARLLSVPPRDDAHVDAHLGDVFVLATCVIAAIVVLTLMSVGVIA